jgi:hypothetical protein
MTVVLHLVTDRETARGAGAALARRVAAVLPGAVVEFCTVAPRDTLAAGFRVAELARAGAGAQRLVAHWVAPASDGPGTWPDGAGRRLCVGRSVVGTRVVGPNVGYCWSCALAELDGLCFLDVPAPEDAGADWVDRLATAIAHAHAAHPHAVAGAVPRTLVPPAPDCAVAHVEADGTLKTTLGELPAPSGTPLDVRIGPVSAPAIASDGSVEPADGQLLLTPATSDWQADGGLGARFLELRQGGGSAAARFATPASGTPIEIALGQAAAPTR